MSSLLEKKRERAKRGLRLIGKDPNNPVFTTIGSLVFTGSPGTGKSFCLAFIALVCHHAGIPFKLVGHDRGNVFDGYADSPSVKSANPCELIHLIDHNTTAYLSPSHRVIFTSPHNERLTKLRKHPSPHEWFMDIWTLDDLRECARTCYGYTNADVTRYVDPLFKKFGGLIRFVIRKKEGEDLIQFIDDNILKRIKQIHSYDTLVTTLNVHEETGTEKSYVLVHIRVLEEDHIGGSRKTIEVCGSDYIRDQSVERIDLKLDERQMAMYFAVSGGGSEAASFKGQLFQALTERALCQTWTQYAENHAICYLGSVKPEGVEIMHPAPTKILKVTDTAMVSYACRSPAQVWKGFGGEVQNRPVEAMDDEPAEPFNQHTLVYCLNKSFPIGEFERVSPPYSGTDYDVFQSTVSNDHPLTEQGLIDLKRRFPPPRSRGGLQVTVLRVFFCVPPGRFHKTDSNIDPPASHIKQQPIHKSKADKQVGACPDGLVIHQFALEVNPVLLRSGYV